MSSSPVMAITTRSLSCRDSMVSCSGAPMAQILTLPGCHRDDTTSLCRPAARSEAPRALVELLVHPDLAAAGRGEDLDEIADLLGDPESAARHRLAPRPAPREQGVADVPRVLHLADQLLAGPPKA